MRRFATFLLWMHLAVLTGPRHRLSASPDLRPWPARAPCWRANLTPWKKPWPLLPGPCWPLSVVPGVSTKLTVLETLSEKVDQLIVGGGIANTFLAAAGYPVGKSLYEADLIGNARALMEKCQIPLPVDVVVGKEFSPEAQARTVGVEDVADDDMIFDVGPATSALFADIVAGAKTLLWNGPVGVFEFDQFAAGTESLSKAIAASDGFSLAGGGDTLAAIDKYKIADKLSCISTGGGAFLEYVEGRLLPAVDILKKTAKS